MKILGKNYEVKDVFESFMTVPDCVVVSRNKIGTGHGEAKLYVSSTTVQRNYPIGSVDLNRNHSSDVLV